MNHCNQLIPVFKLFQAVVNSKLKAFAFAVIEFFVLFGKIGRAGTSPTARTCNHEISYLDRIRLQEIKFFVRRIITKLGDTYSTEHEVTVVINGRPYEQECTIRGKGTNLIHYTFSSSHSNFEIPMSELTFDGSVMDDKGRSFRHVNALSMQQALATRMNDIDVVSVGTTPMIEQVKDGSKGK